MPLDRTLSIKQRRIDVYLPSMAAKAKWNEEAAKRDMSLSELVFQVMELELAKDALAATVPTASIGLQDEVAGLRQENEDLQKRLEELKILNGRAEADLAEYRAQHILGSDPIKRLDSRLIRFLSATKDRDGRYRVVEAAELRRHLQVNPKNENELKAMARQLEFLETHEVIKRTSKGWMWIGHQTEQ